MGGKRFSVAFVWCVSFYRSPHSKKRRLLQFVLQELLLSTSLLFSSQSEQATTQLLEIGDALLYFQTTIVISIFRNVIVALRTCNVLILLEKAAGLWLATAVKSTEAEMTGANLVRSADEYVRGSYASNPGESASDFIWNKSCKCVFH